MTGAIEQSSEQTLEDGLKQNSTYADGYTNYGSAIEDEPDPEDDAFWIKRARSSYEAAQSWFDVGVRRRMEDNMRLFNSDHPRGSRYHDEDYQKRSRLFRPKIRSGVRKTEAATAAAFFATEDALTCTPPNPRDPIQRAGAEANAELLNYRLQNQIPWFLTCIGAVQDAAKQGVVISKQVWKYREANEVYEEEEIDAFTGESMGSQRTIETRVVADHPDIILRPVENILFSAAADWRNPVQESPFLIDQEPFYVGDIIDRAKVGPQGPYDVAWRELDSNVIRSALKQNYDPIRQAREGHREDRFEESHTDVEDHDVVWVHHNYMRVDGQEWYFATLGTEILLTDVIPLEETTPLKERPYVMGVCTIETHKPYPAGLVELGRPIQEEINDLTNLRIDNIRHIISPRYFIKRGTSVDVRSLLRNIAGGVTAMEDPQNDVHIRQIADTTSSSFQEQDRLAVEMDELVGSFSQSSVAANHNINERVGNTQMLGESANQITELTIRTFSETWVEPVLQQVMQLEQALESDEIVLAIVGQRRDMPPEQVFRMLELPIKVTVNVGFGATNPQKRLEKVAMAFTAIGQINPNWVMAADQSAVVTEILGAVGFKDADRFFPEIADKDKEQDPMMQQLQQENAQLKQALEMDGQKHQVTLQAKQMDIQSRERIEMTKMQFAERKELTQQELAHKLEQNKWQGLMLDHQIKREQNEMRKQELIQQRIALNHTIAMDERQFQLTQMQNEWQTGQQIQAPQRGPDHVNADTGAPTEHAKENKAGEMEGLENMNTGATNVKEPSAPNVTEARPRNPKPKQTKRIASTPRLGNEDKAGVIARGRYGSVPFKEG